jgi:hypothetical protein
MEGADVISTVQFVRENSILKQITSFILIGCIVSSESNSKKQSIFRPLKEKDPLILLYIFLSHIV